MIYQRPDPLSKKVRVGLRVKKSCWPVLLLSVDYFIFEKSIALQIIAKCRKNKLVKEIITKISNQFKKVQIFFINISIEIFKYSF